MDDSAEFIKGRSSSQLVVFLHGFRMNRKRNHAVISAIRNTLPNADVFAPDLPYLKLLSTERLSSVTQNLLESIDEYWRKSQKREQGGYREIYLVGHSTGAVLARKLFVCSFGEVTWPANQNNSSSSDRPAPFEGKLQGLDQRPWFGSIKRLVMIASMSRGWAVDSVKSKLEAFLWSTGSLLGHLMINKPTIFDIRRGAPFISETRLQWLAMMDPRSGFDPSTVIVVQLLGTVDNIVAPDDNLDFALDNSARFPTLFFVQVPRSHHASIIDMSPDGGMDTAKPVRLERFRLSLAGQPTDLRSISTPREYLSDDLPPAADETVAHVAFVVHGIRDLGYWTEKISAEIKRKSNGRTKTLSPSYGFFAMAPFVLPWVRRQKAEWFMDQYVQTRAQFPKAEFSYVGHSNGTYILSRALKDYSGCTFRNIVFAGSVVRSDFDWAGLADKGKVKRVLNYVATGDWVVALFPYAARNIDWLDLGGAGHVGFSKPNRNVANIEYVTGDHSAGIDESHWVDIAEFIENGTRPSVSGVAGRFSETQSPRWQLAGRWSPLLTPLVLSALCLIVGGFGFYAIFIYDSALMTLGFVSAI